MKIRVAAMHKAGELRQLFETADLKASAELR
jgi:hypothetical protein